MKQYKIEAHGATDAGRVRETNEDQFLIASLEKTMLVEQTSLGIDDRTPLESGLRGHLLLVADGVGGRDAGEVASAMAIGCASRYVLNTMPWFFRLRGEHEEEDLLDELKAALQRSNEVVHGAPDRGRGRAGMATTLTMAYVLWPRAYVVHVGDSRCYLARDETIEQVTTDHTVAQDMLEQGLLSKAEAESSRWSNVLWNAIGGQEEDVAADVYKVRLEEGDTLLLCSDGLTRHVDDDEILRAIRGGARFPELCRSLVDLTNERGAKDNVTVVAARMSRGDDAAPSESSP